ncbi:Oidioi.mRNA.OKI2018_I69.XSR.g16712.t1.cds [Oikopleura dioica]|uniref:Oidioi.mRNA.OKI2018_I69.XSR.g16712.t1.cds n=1 Tax=Oikopleura dioica TaxID=34765 RepID=A0ABN7SH01_OIKDI|nr:Oidioi.mRNA.OKI2018_I69.XSR.g16712.t1.cds [Oikopleura dioica]
MIIKPIEALQSLKKYLENATKKSSTSKLGYSETTLRRTGSRRCSRSNSIAQSFSAGTIKRSRLNRKSHRESVRYTVIQAESESEEENIMENNHVRVVEAFDEIVSELESVSLVAKCRSLIRPSSIKSQRPQSAYVPKGFGSTSSSGVSSPDMADRDSGYQSSIFDDGEDSSAQCTEKIFKIVDFWSKSFPGDLQIPETLHILMGILEHLRSQEIISLQQSSDIVLRVHRHSALLCNRLVAPRFQPEVAKKNLRLKPFVKNYSVDVLAEYLTCKELQFLRQTCQEDFLTFGKRRKNSLDLWAEWFNELSQQAAAQVCLVTGYAMKKVRSQRLRVLKHITDPSFNFKNYRIISKHQSKSLPCEIPFVSLLVKDACFQAEEIRKLGQEAPLPTEKLFHAFSQTALPLSKLYERQQNPPSQKLNATLDAEFRLCDFSKSDDFLFMGSFKLESPANAFEKSLYKQTKQKIKNAF